ncbi:copper homeostasis protein CutC [Nocardia neocaledoniensis NBRC 108232]|uniref:PF03932 family protein CutC n=1 Tax=Nocardia neocaledoniensis TaxID=236511 RepID=A0A317N8E9_9NOCA|nr:copper homeostasis protein CutC [Nocardia neocaledoniensis]PWV71222.1 copper homeostasis protein CutC [Nocardia neocaledoniensis]GEM35281.1 copper homeostasis protein CutC [Nocardia neocaledoniensis NBRC 108232]
MTALEFAVQDVAGALGARRVGADRVELCAALGGTGGLTASIGTIAAVVATGMPVHALIRCRAGGFEYRDPAEVAVMNADARAAVSAGVAGLVLGALTPQRRVDVDTLRRVLEGVPVEDIELTFHRAIDVISDRAAAVDTLVELGITRVLTSGGATRCAEGIADLAAMVDHAAGRIQIMAGGGVTVADLPALHGAGVDAVHLSARRVVADDGGPGGGGTTGHDQLDEDVAFAVAAQLRQLDLTRPVS